MSTKPTPEEKASRLPMPCGPKPGKTSKASTNWKKMHDMQQKLVISYVLENQNLESRIKDLELALSVEKLTNHLIRSRISRQQQKEEIIP